MDIGYLTSDAAKYPSKDWKKVIILGMLSLLSFLIVPGFLTMGYLFRALKWSIAGVDDLPDFDEWGEMFVDGFKVFVVQLAYFIVPAVILFLSVWASIGSLLALQSVGDVTVPTTVFSLMGGLFFLGVIVSVIFGVFFTIALANMAYYNGEIRAAFRFHEITDRIAAIGWVDLIIWYVMMMIIGLGIGFVASILFFIPILGWILIILIIYPYLYLLYARALGLLFVSGFEKQ
ncbi:DUF4013 domain-containing protein [Methanobacterium petrolearium]|uniref:DUF4013 domain-containing protein n=1 Tax=Methanobacterium petrolearium TaxID=710190 RepID=UPI001AE7D830|nr:DUF4013 domain-containing protein [Methanobacterium petrolearium]MBP1947067.1 hypothetical protein [Methanobacterium petrolearium]BDZ69710.1 hypothetical protein GCM10025861_02270 [Methanobacterium petrolearium]